MEIAFGYCHCGCGHLAPICKENNAKKGLVKGRPREFICGHAGASASRKSVRYIVEDRGYSTPCWIWQLALDEDGYGQESVKHVSSKAHRNSYEAKYGPIPDGLVPDHLCKVRCCVNPGHIELVTWEVSAQRTSNVKLSNDDVRLARSLWGSGHTAQQIAARLGVSASVAHDAATRRSWKNID